MQKKLEDKVSIIVPIYNVEEYVAKCLESLMAQTYKNIEIFAIIDGSKDRSAEVVKKYQAKDDRIVCIEKDNGGYGSVLEYAINEKVQSEYFLICDPDDYIAKDAIEKLINAAKKNDSDIVIGNYYNVYSEGDDSRIQVKAVEPINRKVKPGHKYNKEESRIFALAYSSPHAKLFRTKLVSGISFPKKVSYTDLILYLFAIEAANSILYIDDYLAYYLIERPGNTVTEKNPKRINDSVVVWNYIFNGLKKGEAEDSYIYYRLYKQLTYGMIKEYKMYADKQNGYNEIIEAFKKLKTKKKYIRKVFNEGLKRRILFELLLNRITSILFIKILLKVVK